MEIDLWPGGGKYCGLFNIDFGIKPGDRVLDVGGGHRPFPLSTHVCDMIDTNKQRHGIELALGNREFLEGKVENVLAKVEDNHFDFVYSNHVFEHIDNLSEAIKQINRTCKRGFAAFPASDFEFLTAKNHFHHVNLIRVIDGAIHFCKRPQNTIVQKMAELFERQLFNHPEFNSYWEGHGCRGFRFIWEGRIYWEESLRYQYYRNHEKLYPQLRFFRK